MRPSRHVIKGVPFAAWGDARKWIGSDSNTNPSLLASNAMAMEYWRENGAPSEKSPATEWPHHEIQTREELEDTIAQDIPVVVFAGLTPFGHPTETEWVMTKWGDPCLSDATAKMRRHSGILGTILSYEVFAQATLPILLSESVFTSPRVAVG